MTDVVIDTGVLLDYLAGDERAQRALAPCVHRAISVVTWLELMACLLYTSPSPRDS